MNGNKLDGNSAKEYCRSLGDGVELVKINSVEENEFVLQLVREKAPSLRGFWIGLVWHVNSNRWAWSDNSDPVYTNWREGEPNGNANSPCGHMIHNNPSPINGYWNDASCSYQTGLVCKKLAS